MKHLLKFLLLCWICESAWSGAMSTTEKPILGCYDELQGGEYPAERIQERPDWSILYNIRINCTAPYDNLVSQLSNTFNQWSEWSNWQPARRSATDRKRVARGFQGFRSNAYDFASNYTHWPELCRAGQAAIDCINNRQSHCNDSFGPWFFREGEFYLYDVNPEVYTTELFRAFPSRTCTGSSVKNSLQTILTEKPDWNCIELDAIETKCLDPWLDELYENYNPSATYNPAERQYWKEMSTAMLRCAIDLLAASNCSKTQQELHYQATKILLPWTVDVDELDPNSAGSIDYSQFQRCTVGVYGDPHIRLCDAPSLITCSSPGSQIYYSGPMLEIIGVNTRVRSTRATTITNIDIKFYSESNSLVGRYQAGNSQLPSTLVGGQSSAGPLLGAVHVITVQADYRVDLIYVPLGLIIKLRRSGGNYFFTMRAANALFSAGSGLLVTGCPTSQRLDISRENRVRRGITDTDCETACEPLLQTEFYDACSYDCRTVRSITITQMTRQASEMEDEVKLNDTELRGSAITVNYEGIGLNPRTSPNTASMLGFSLLGVMFTLAVSIYSAV